MIFLGPNSPATLWRPQTQATWDADGATDIIQLSKQNLYREIALELVCQPTLTLANNTVANTKLGDEWAVVERIRLVANSSDIIFELTGNDLWWLNYFLYGTPPKINVTLGDGATANPTLRSTLILPIWALRAMRPMDSAYDASDTTDFRIEISFGTYTDINATATGWTTAPTVSVVSHEVQPSPGFTPPLVPRIVKRVDDITAANSAFRIPLDVGPFYRGFIFNVTNAAGTADDSGSSITNFRIVSGSTAHRDMPANLLREVGILRGDNPNGIEIDSTGIARRTALRISGSNDPRGWYFLNLCPDGFLTEAIASPTFNDAYIELNASAACRVNTISLQLFKNRNANKNAA